MAIEPVRSIKLSDAIADHLEQLIFEGALRPGERLAAERELAEKLEVSRPSLREALDKLQRRGLIETNRSGTFVTRFMAPLTEPLAAMMQANDQALLDYLEYRGLVEGETARLAALRATEPEREAIKACLDKMREAHAKDDPTDEAEADADLHMLIYEGSHNVVMLHIMRAFSDMLRHGVFYNRHQLYSHPGAREDLLQPASRHRRGRADARPRGRPRRRLAAHGVHGGNPENHPRGADPRRPRLAPHGPLRIRGVVIWSFKLTSGRGGAKQNVAECARRMSGGAHPLKTV